MKKLVEKIVFNTKWLLVIFILGLILALGVYAFVYLKEIWHLILEANSLDKASALPHILEFVDTTLVATLIVLIISGSYDTFISREHGHSHENISSGGLKIKLGAVLLGVSSVHLYQVFISAQKVDWPTLNKQLAIHGAFLIGLIVLAITEHIHVKDKKIHHDMHHRDKEKK